MKKAYMYLKKRHAFAQIKCLFNMFTCTKANDCSKAKQLRKLATQQMNERTQNTKQFTFYNFYVGVIYSVLLEFGIWCLLINGWLNAF